MSKEGLVQKRLEVIRKLKSMDRDSPVWNVCWEEFVGYYQAFIFSAVHRVVRHPHDAEDVQQEVYFRIIRSLRTFDEEKGTMLSWLSTIIINTKNSYYHNVPYMQDIDPDEIMYIDDRFSLEERAQDEMVYQQLEEYLDGLVRADTPRNQNRKKVQVFRLKIIEGYTIAEAAKMVGVSNTVATNWIYRLRKQITQKFS